jgi:hypothetical protein
MFRLRKQKHRSWRTITGVVGAVTVSAIALLATTGPAHAVSTRHAWQWINANSQLCIGIRSGSGAIGAAVLQWGCNNNNDQGWESFGWMAGSNPRDVGTSIHNAGLLVNFGANNRCLGTLNGETGNGTKIISKACNSSNTDELWRPVSAYWHGYGAGFGYVLENNKTAYQKCLGVPGSDRTQGVQLVLWDCNGHLDQVWHLGGEYLLT